MAFEKLLEDDGSNIVPTEEDLAFFASADGMHGFEAVIPKHAQYWRRQARLARDRVEPAREDLARVLWKWLTLEGNGPTDYDFTRIPNATAEDREGWRRTILGGLAFSMAIRSGLSSVVEGPIVDGRGAGEARFVSDLSIEKSEREWPYEPRLHIALDEEPGLRDGDRWGRNGRLITCFRYPADVTPVMEDYLAQRDMSIDTRRSVTVMPHLTALQSPQFSAG